MLAEHQDAMRYQQLKLYETLLSGSSDRARSLMSNQSFLRPLLDLLNQFAKRTAATTLAPTEGSNGSHPPFSPPMSPTMPPPSLNKQESIQVHFISGHPWGPRVAWTSHRLEGTGQNCGLVSRNRPVSTGFYKGFLVSFLV